MSLHNYAAASSGLALELVESLTREEVLALRASLIGVSAREWLDWCDRHAGHIEGYVQATPSQRMKKKAWEKPVLRAQLVLAAIRHCRFAHALLRTLHENEFWLSPGGSYRDTTASAGEICQALLRIDMPVWPPEWAAVCPSPFDK